MSGNIHFVTPTNRWIGSISLSTLDPLTLEPLSTYLRHGTIATEGKDPHGKGTDSPELEEDLDRTTNMTGEPVSLILARLQTTPRGCACGCTVPSPPRHSDYYHGQHLLRLLFQTQRVRSRSIRNHLPQYFDQHSDTDDDDDDEVQDPAAINPASTFSSVVIPIDAPCTNTTSDNQTRPKKIQRKQKVPKWVHSLVQNRAIRNPLTNTETQGDPTFFVVLEPGKGGWWYEPWAMATRPVTMDGIPQRPSYQNHHHHHQPSPAGDPPQQQPVESVEPTPEMLLVEKELRKERWRQSRIANLEIEAQHELDWRRWQRSLLGNQPRQKSSKGETSRTRRHGMDTNNLQRPLAHKKPRNRIMRFRIGKDMTLLEPAESALRLPKRVRNCPKPSRVSLSTLAGNSTVYPLVQASSALDESELEDVRQRQTQDQQKTRDHQHFDSDCMDNKDAYTHAQRKKSQSPTMPWWEPDPKPFTMPSTKLSPFAISTLPEPVAKLFGGTSIYAPRPKKEEQPQSQEESASEQPDPTVPTATATATDRPPSEPRADTSGCKWVPVQDGDRVAVMIGTSQDFLLFPSFQRLFLRHLSREDFQDRVGRVTVIPCPASTVIVESRRAHDGGRRESREEEERVPEEVEAGNRHPEQGDGDRDEYGQQVEQGSGETIMRRPWPRWLISRSSRTDTGGGAGTSSSSTAAATNASLMESTQPSTELLGADQSTRGQTDTESELTMATQDTEKRRPDIAAKTVAKPVPSTTWTYDWETFKREDYDSSEYSFSSGECSDEETQDALCYYSETTSSGEDADASSSDDDGDPRSRARQTNTASSSSPSSSSSSSWSFCHLSRLLLFFKRSPPPAESRRARQRRLRRERWQQHQNRLLQHQSIPPRFLPGPIRQRMDATQTRHCWQALEFCRFYLTILLAISLMGGIVYGAIHVEQGGRGHGRGARADVAPVHRPPEMQAVDVNGPGSGGALGGVNGQAVLMAADPVPPSGLKPRPAGSRHVPAAGGRAGQEHPPRRPQKPLAAT